MKLHHSETRNSTTHIARISALKLVRVHKILVRVGLLHPWKARYYFQFQSLEVD